jgi:hypothetical protein
VRLLVVGFSVSCTEHRGRALLVVKGDIESSVFLLPHARTHRTTKKKKKFAPVTRIVVVTRRFVTYGIRAGTTRDLGFTTGSVDMMVLIMLLLIELICLCAGNHG